MYGIEGRGLDPNAYFLQADVARSNRYGVGGCRFREMYELENEIVVTDDGILGVA